MRYRAETQQGNEGNPLWEALLCRYWIASYSAHMEVLMALPGQQGCSSPPGSAAPQPCSPDKRHFLSKGVWDYSEMSVGILAEYKCMWAHVRRTSSRLCTGLQKFAIKFIFPTYHHITASDLKQYIFRQTLWKIKKNLIVNVDFDLKEIRVLKNNGNWHA